MDSVYDSKFVSLFIEVVAWEFFLLTSFTARASITHLSPGSRAKGPAGQRMRARMSMFGRVMCIGI